MVLSPKGILELGVIIGCSMQELAKAEQIRRKRWHAMMDTHFDRLWYFRCPTCHQEQQRVTTYYYINSTKMKPSGGRDRHNEETGHSLWLQYTLLPQDSHLLVSHANVVKEQHARSSAYKPACAVRTQTSCNDLYLTVGDLCRWGTSTSPASACFMSSSASDASHGFDDAVHGSADCWVGVG